MSPQTEVLIKLALTLAGLVVLLWRMRKRPESSSAGAALGLVAVLAAAAHLNFFTFHSGHFTHFAENFHYQLGSKYFPEVGYDGLYQASVAAQAESAPSLPLPREIRDLLTNAFIPVRRVDAHREEVIRRFTPDRWRSFVKDHSEFLDRSYIHNLNEARHDHGYNPTPTWTFVARLFNAWLPLDATTIPILALLDWVILGATFVVVFRTYGSGVGATALLLFGVGYPWRYGWVGGGFLRYDWLAAIVIGTCLLKRRRFGAAGFLFAYSAAVRLFPALILFGVAAVAAWGLIRRTSVSWAVRFGAGALAGAVVFFLAGAMTGRGFAAWPEFVHNIEKHHDTWSTNRAGLEFAVVTTPKTMLSRIPISLPLSQRSAMWQEEMNLAQRARRPLCLGLAILLVAGAAAAAATSRPDEGAAIGVTAVFAGLVLSCYYWVVLVVLAFRRSTDGAVGILAANAAALIAALFTDDTQIIFAVFSWAVLAALASLVVSDVTMAARSGWAAPPAGSDDGVARGGDGSRAPAVGGRPPRHRPKARKHARALLLPEPLVRLLTLGPARPTGSISVG